MVVFRCEGIIIKQVRVAFIPSAQFMHGSAGWRISDYMVWFHEIGCKDGGVTYNPPSLYINN